MLYSVEDIPEIC
uniref:Uncharacterized protein n=1 Tax=Anguilla anguilla TaxID=7936 RepID=A0A0E9RI25_ANGAN